MGMTLRGDFPRGGGGSVGHARFRTTARECTQRPLCQGLDYGASGISATAADAAIWDVSDGVWTTPATIAALTDATNSIANSAFSTMTLGLHHSGSTQTTISRCGRAVHKRGACYPRKKARAQRGPAITSAPEAMAPGSRLCIRLRQLRRRPRPCTRRSGQSSCTCRSCRHWR